MNLIELLIIIICGVVILFLIHAALLRWIFRVDEHVLLLKQIWQELKKLNHGKE